MNNRSNTVAPEREIDEILEKQCRFCMGTQDTRRRQLISPCKCRGSLKYIHEECLKTWLLSQEGDIDASRCELCHTNYLMEFKIKNRCSLNRMCDDRLIQCFLIPVLLSVMMMLTVILVTLMRQYMSEETGYTIFLAILCLMCDLVMFVILVYSCTSTFCQEKLVQWSILNQEFEEEVTVNQFLNDSVAVVVPDVVKIQGRTVKAPSYDGERSISRVVAFTPMPYVAASSSIPQRFVTDPLNIDDSSITDSQSFLA